MNSDINFKGYFADNMRNLIYLVIITVILIIIIYSASQTSLEANNCTKISKQFKSAKYTAATVESTLDTIPMSQLFIKTAYNCCCSGKFKNDYVDVCALQNCANYGVRALDFQVYKLNDKAIISASTVNDIQYKEIYNYLDFNATMLNVQKYFINGSINKDEPLFLIFRVFSKAKDTYDQMFTSLNNIFGAGATTQKLYITTDLANTTFQELKYKVVICVQYCIHPTYVDTCNSVFYTSSLSRITSLFLNGPTNNVYRETDVLHNTAAEYVAMSTINYTTLNVLYPNQQTNSHNYDFILSGFDNGISFIGLNFQKNDTHLKLFNTSDITDSTNEVTTVNGFGGYAFKQKPASISVDTTNDLTTYINEFKDNIAEGNGILSNMISTSLLL